MSYLQHQLIRTCTCTIFLLLLICFQQSRVIRVSGQIFLPCEAAAGPNLAYFPVHTTPWWHRCCNTRFKYSVYRCWRESLCKEGAVWVILESVGAGNKNMYSGEELENSWWNTDFFFFFFMFIRCDEGPKMFKIIFLIY